MSTKNKNTAKKKSSTKKSAKTAPPPMKGRDILVKALENEGVKVIFGYPGGASMEIHQGLTLSKKIRMVLPRHCLLYTSPSPRDRQKSRMPSSA